jgi:hypothetical protein
VGYWIVAVIIVLITIFILTAQFTTVIDTGRKEFIDAFSFYGMSVGKERKQFRELNKIVITKGQYKQNINTRSQSRTLRWTDYTATLIYDNGRILDLVTREDKSDVIVFAKLYSTALGIGIEDRSISSSSSRSLA